MSEPTDNQKSLVDKAIALQNEKKYEEAVVLLLSIEQEVANMNVVNGLIATQYYLMDKYDQAIPWFEKVLARSPTNDSASSGLFHCLNETNRANEALVEFKRFLTANPIPRKDNYKWILEDLLDDIDNPLFQDYREFIIQAGAKLELHL